jgi:hypothetical protein
MVRKCGLGRQGNRPAAADRREPYRYRQFHLTHPRIVEALPPRFASQLGGAARRLPGRAAGSGDRVVPGTCYSAHHRLMNVTPDPSRPCN